MFRPFLEGHKRRSLNFSRLHNHHRSQHSPCLRRMVLKGQEGTDLKESVIKRAGKYDMLVLSTFSVLSLFLFSSNIQNTTDSSFKYAKAESARDPDGKTDDGETSDSNGEGTTPPCLKWGALHRIKKNVESKFPPDSNVWKKYFDHHDAIQIIKDDIRQFRGEMELKIPKEERKDFVLPSIQFLKTSKTNFSTVTSLNKSNEKDGSSGYIVKFPLSNDKIIKAQLMALEERQKDVTVGQQPQLKGGNREDTKETIGIHNSYITDRVLNFLYSYFLYIGKETHHEGKVEQIKYIINPSISENPIFCLLDRKVIFYLERERVLTAKGVDSDKLQNKPFSKSLYEQDPEQNEVELTLNLYAKDGFTIWDLFAISSVYKFVYDLDTGLFSQAVIDGVREGEENNTNWLPPFAKTFSRKTFFYNIDPRGRKTSYNAQNDFNSNETDIQRSDFTRKLHNMGVEVHWPMQESEKEQEGKIIEKGIHVSSKAISKNYMNLDWSDAGGYDDVKQYIESSIILPLKFPDKYRAIVEGTRKRYEPNRPRAILMEGPPGTGKTLTARIIACRVNFPLVHLPLTSIMSKYYGETENKLSEILSTCEQMGGAIIFIDEIDALATSRGSDNMHEATRRLLSVLLTSIEGFKGQSNNIILGATNRKMDLDQALLSRFDTVIYYPLPDLPARKAIFAMYAKQLSCEEHETLGQNTEGASARDIKEICENAERNWAQKLISNVGEDSGIKHKTSKRGIDMNSQLLPNLQEYISACERVGVMKNIDKNIPSTRHPIQPGDSFM